MAFFESKYAYTVGVVIPARPASSRSESAASPSSRTSSHAASTMVSRAAWRRASRHSVEIDGLDMAQESYTLLKICQMPCKSEVEPGFELHIGDHERALAYGCGVTVHSIGALLLISDDAERLAVFYRDAMGLPLEEERHDNVTLHYGCEIGGMHFAIHPSADWPGAAVPDAQSPVIVFYSDDITSAYEQLVAHDVPATPPFDHGFAVLTAFRDPDGNNVQVMSLAERPG